MRGCRQSSGCLCSRVATQPTWGLAAGLLTLASRSNHRVRRAAARCGDSDTITAPRGWKNLMTTPTRDAPGLRLSAQEQTLRPCCAFRAKRRLGGKVWCECLVELGTIWVCGRVSGKWPLRNGEIGCKRLHATPCASLGSAAMSFNMSAMTAALPTARRGRSLSCKAVAAAPGGVRLRAFEGFHASSLLSMGPAGEEGASHVSCCPGSGAATETGSMPCRPGRLRSPVRQRLRVPNALLTLLVANTQSPRGFRRSGWRTAASGA